MKLREDVQKNRVWTHGSVYVDHNEFIPICPECCSDKVTTVPEGQETAALYTCTDCGCEFDAWKGSERTKLGKTVHVIIVVLMVLFAIAAVAFFILGAVYGAMRDKAGGDPVRDGYLLNVLGISIGLPALCCITEFMLSKIDDNI